MGLEKSPRSEEHGLEKVNGQKNMRLKDKRTRIKGQKNKYSEKGQKSKKHGPRKGLGIEKNMDLEMGQKAKSTGA